MQKAAGRGGGSQGQPEWLAFAGRPQSSKRVSIGRLRTGSIHPQAAERRIAAEQRANAEIEKDREGFAERVRALSDSAADREIGNYARIRSEAKRELDRLEKDFQEHTRNMDKTDPEYGRYLALKITGQQAVAGSEGAQYRQSQGKG